MVRRAAPCLLLSLLACAPAGPDAAQPDDAALATLVRSVADVLDGVLAGLEGAEALAGDTGGAPPPPHAQGDGEYVYQGTFDGAGVWWDAGTVTIDGAGTVSEQGTRTELEATLALAGVDAGRGLTLDGELHWALTQVTSGGRITVDYTVLGTLDVSGDWEGAVPLDLGRRAEPVEGGLDITWSGTAGGRPVSALPL